MILAAAFQSQLAYGFAAGLVAAVNPCGFAMLPAYLSFFLGIEGETDRHVARAIPRALAVSGVMTAGFVVVFALVGTILARLFRSIADQVGWLTLAIGLVLVAGTASAKVEDITEMSTNPGATKLQLTLKARQGSKPHSAGQAKSLKNFHGH